MSSWLISVPAWGDHYVNYAKHVALPNIMAALSQSVLPARVVVHTDQPDELAISTLPFEKTIEYRPVPIGCDWNQYPNSHREVLAEAKPGHYVSMLCADAAVSREFFVAMERRFREGKKAVVMEGPRTLSEQFPPLAAQARELADWGLQNMHPIAKRCFYGIGDTNTPSIVYFKSPMGVVKHAFHMGPIGFVVDEREYKCEQSNDGDLMNSFYPDELHIPQPDEMWIVECSPPNKDFGSIGKPLHKSYIAEWANNNTNDTHRWLFKQPVVMSGIDVGASRPIVEAVLEELAVSYGRHVRKPRDVASPG